VVSLFLSFFCFFFFFFLFIPGDIRGDRPSNGQFRDARVARVTRCLGYFGVL
jgi:hypothetical protein